MLIKNRQGFSLVEITVVMVITLVVIMVTSSAFQRIITNSSQQSRSVESQNEGIVGLEVLRADLEQAGFGLPWSFQNAITYVEATNAATKPSAFWPTGKSPASFNDAPGNPPRAILSGTTTFNKDAAGIGSSYLVIKSIMAAANDSSKKWTSFSYDKDNNLVSPRLWGSTERDLTRSEQVIVVKNLLTDDVRNQIREIRVYILAQEGIMDLRYSYPSRTVDVGESFDGGATVTGRRFDLLDRIGADYKYYRWKVYTIVVRPKNLIQ